MALLTLEQLKARHPGAQAKQLLSLDNIKENQQVNQQVAERTQGNTYQKPQEEKGFLRKAGEFVTDITGGRKLLEGGVMSVFAKGEFERMAEQDKQTADIAVNLQKEIGKNLRAGQPTDRLEKAYRGMVAEMSISQDRKNDLLAALPSDSEVIGSATRLATTLVAPTIAGKAAKAATLGRGITGVGGGILRGASAGAVGGAVEGFGQGVGLGLEKQDTSLENIDAGEALGSGAIGAAVGAGTGGVLGGAIGGVTGALAGKEQRLLDSVTPSPKELGKKGFEDALRRGDIIPATATQPSRVRLGAKQQETALKFSGLIDDNPVKTSINIMDKVDNLDSEVGSFLKKNNGIFNKGELRNSLIASMDDIDDISIDASRMERAKTKLVDSFMDRVEKGDMESLWQQRKLFDNDIEKAFTGSLTAQKQMKIGLRTAVQDFIAEGTPEGIYKGYMGDMSNLYRLQETVSTKAFGQKDLSLIRKWMRNNPLKVKAVGGAAVLGVGQQFLPSFGDGE